jgi:hypothetical protein
MAYKRSLSRCLMLAFFVAWGAVTAEAGPKPSFNCAGASSPDERVICATPGLIALDRVANDGYLFLRDKLGKSKANKINLPLIKKRQNCGADAACIRAAQLESIAIFQKYGAKIEAPAERRPPVEKPATTVAAPVAEPVAELPPEAPAPVPAPRPRSPQPVAEVAAPAPETGVAAAPPDVSEGAPAPVAPESSEAVAAPEPPLAQTTESEEGRTVVVGEAPPTTDEATDEPPREIDGESAVTEPPSEPVTTVGSGDRAPEPAASGAAPSAPVAEKEVVETFRKKHLFAFILAGAVFALLAFYLVRKLRGEHGAQSAPVAASEPGRSASPSPAARPLPTGTRPELPPTRMNPGELRTKLTPPDPLGKSGSAASAKQKDDGSLAWVWSKYKGKV